MRDFLRSVLLIGLFGAGALVMAKAVEEERARARALRLEIEASRLTEQIFIEKIETLVDTRDAGHYMNVPIPDRQGHVRYEHVWIPETREKRTTYLVDKNKRMFYVPERLRLALIPFKQGDCVWVTTIKRPKDTFRELEVVSPEKPSGEVNEREKMVKYGARESD